jgi:type IV secretory pathway VirB10-like protein
MKTTASRIMLIALVALASYNLFAQDNDSKPDSQKYRLYIVKDENGNKEVIDKTFASKEETDAYIKTNKIEAPETDMPEPPMPPMPPTPPVAPSAPGEKQSPVKKEKKIIIIEKEEGGINGQTDFSIDLSQLSPDEASKVVQEVINMNVAKIEVVHVKKEVKNDFPSGLNTTGEEKSDQRVGINNTTASNSANVANLKVYPNPGRQFHVECNVTKPGDVKLRILDMQGKEVYEEAMNTGAGKFEKDINAAGLGKGTYLMDVEAGGARATTTVVLQ